MRNPFAPVRVGDRWGPPWSTTWFHVRGRVPDAWQGRRVVAVFDLGYDGPTGFTCEALAWKDGKPWRGVDPNHRWLPIDGPEVDFYLEAAANPRATEAGAEAAESMIALRESPDPAFVLRRAELAVAEPPGGHISARLDRAHRITAVGHAHIDTAWEWPLRKAFARCGHDQSVRRHLIAQGSAKPRSTTLTRSLRWVTPTSTPPGSGRSARRSEKSRAAGRPSWR